MRQFCSPFCFLSFHRLFFSQLKIFCDVFWNHRVTSESLFFSPRGFDRRPSTEDACEKWSLVPANNLNHELKAKSNHLPHSRVHTHSRGREREEAECQSVSVLEVSLSSCAPLHLRSSIFYSPFPYHRIMYRRWHASACRSDGRVASRPLVSRRRSRDADSAKAAHQPTHTPETKEPHHGFLDGNR